ncbi:TetR/AcrR family transcriptional regulator [Nocardioides insulae]|uniref:TetR/AcrR family transcriptional regulator n=1 Tax=Nocardioides insulae TaxID=394734 RepID=UPI00040DC44C|nr:TetR family transcriptional regulator [Nocardioides insulae]
MTADRLEPPRTRARQQRSRDTELLLIEAALRALVEYGYAGASTLRIQRLAGVSRGRLLHHFPSRDALLIAAVRHLVHRRLEESPTSIDPALGPEERIDAAVTAMWLSYHSEMFWASAELWLASRQVPELRRSLLPSEQQMGAALAESCGRLFGPDLAARPGYADLRELLNTSMRGVAFTYAFTERDPSTDPHLPGWRRLARGVLL